MAKALKHMLAAELEADLRENPGMLLVDPGPMTVEAVQGFRTDLREKAGGARMRVIHNRTARYAFDNLFDDADGLTAELIGPSAVAFGGAGPIAIARVIKDWQRKLIDAPQIDRLNLGAIPSTKLDWFQPHEGNIVQFLFRPRSFQILEAATV